MPNFKFYYHASCIFKKEKDEYLNVNIPLFGLVESCFGGIKYDELKSKTLEKLNLLSTEIQKLLDLNITNPISF